MITIKSGERTIYHPGNPGLQLIEPRLTLEDNAAGSLTFRIYGENLNLRKLPALVVFIVNRIIPVIIPFEPIHS